ncbi:filamentous hemagglutinin N-terminal domain-containing protein [Nostoc sp. CHAB 5784]|uniref:two-partner secretion domain-containing protein n=1 Tax=Nostoc mirabile TaxID=2907820 RepID=UPI001E64024B|nr:filamentous hemagglutinin N-terminal domain-containing protein [Nostoc mirabile]MCC5666500.1 filamentous hemagglutinin N-terminal domain-containing protein [Nostoc mirabile CHAB5784]
MKVTEKSSILQASYKFWSVPNIQPENMVRCDLGDRSNILKFWQIGITLAATSGVIFSGNGAIAQIVPDRTLGAESSVVTPNVDIKGTPSDRIEGGAIRGANLFHSFQEFNVRDGRGAYFNNPAGIESIFSRVTGNNASNINGKLGVLGNANLFLLNPNGILFGPNASLDLNGSFLGSTANALKFGDGKEFSATNPTAPPLLSVSVPLGVQFNQGQPSAILNSGNISVAQNLTLLGGTVASTGQLSASGGQVAVAAVPGGSVVNLSSTGQFQNIDTSLPVAAGNSVSLAELLTSSNAQFHPGLTVNSNGQVEVAGSGLSVRDGDVVAKNVTAQTATLTAHNNLTLVESLIGTNGDLNLLAGDTVRVRDNVENPFVAQAGGQLLVQGRQGVDIFALNNPNSGLFSGGDLVLRSANAVGGDAQYWAGGNFRIEKLDGNLGGLFSPYDPIIRSAGDVSFDSYTGGSLHILAGGSVRINGTVEITGTDPNALPGNGLTETVSLSNDDPNGIRSQVNIDGTNFPTLDIRAGVRANALGSQGNFVIPTTGIILAPTPAFPGQGNTISPPGSPQNANPDTPSANIIIGRIKTEPRGQVFLTNQYEANPLAEGSIEIGDSIGNSNLFSIDSLASPVTIDTRGSVTVYQGIISGIRTGIGGDIKILSQTGNINIGTGSTQTNNPINGSLLSLSNNGSGGNITLTAGGNITATGNITSEVFGGDGNGGNITLISNFGEINSGGITIKSKSNDGDANTNNGLAGNVTIQALRDIRFDRSSIEASSNSNEEGFSTIELNSLEGSVFLNNANLKTTNTGTGFAGDIRINGSNIQITDTGRGDNQGIQSRGVNGRIFIGIDDQDRVTANNVTIRNSRVDTQTIANVNSNVIPNEGDGIQIRSTGSIDIINSDVSTSIRGIGNGGNININTGSLSVTGGSRVEATVNNNVNNQAEKIQVQGGNITINARDRVIFDGVFDAVPGLIIQSAALSNVEQGATGNAGDITIKTGSLEVTNGALLETRTRGNGNAGKLTINANSVVFDGAGGNFPNAPGAFSGVESDAIGKGGDIEINTGLLSLNNFAQIATNTSGRGDPGNIKITASNGDVKVDNRSFINAQIQRGGVGTLGIKDDDFRISINATSLTLNNGSQINAFTNDTGSGDAPIGSAGNIDINVGNGNVKIEDLSDNNDITGIFNTLGNGGINPSGSGDAVGTGGNLTIQARSLLINGTTNRTGEARGNAGIAAKTFGLGNAGKIKITLTDSLNITNGGFLDNSTAGGSVSTPSNAGPIEVTAKSVILANDNPSRRAIQSKVQRYNFDGENLDAVGNGGDITINTQSLSLDNASITSESETQGTAGNISITADTLSIKQAIEPNINNKEAAITVTSPEGKAGNIDIFANKMFLNNGTLSANTGQESGANITLKGKDNPSLAFIILWNGSKIEANANNNATGGNVDINSKLLIGLPPRAGIVNKITANAAEGQGGKLNITAGIYGFSQSKLKPLELTTSKENYIAASSQTGAAGIVSVGQPIIDPNRGLIKLPEDVRDSSKLIVQGCPVGGQRATSQFVITGRGGLPPNPTSALSSGVLVGNAGEQTGSTNSAPVPTVEAQGVNIGPNGEIILTANPSKLASYSSWQRFMGCDGK